ncbi:MAG TPA: hypothetical protein VGA70_11075 [Longimicrobiales bacterium]|jgi:hypothetical protein
MSAALESGNGYTVGTRLHRGIGLHGRVAVTWAMAGGILSGGFLVALMTLAGRLSGHGLFFTSSGLFVVGAVLGLLHGGFLGFLGRAPDVDRGDALGGLGRALLYAIPAVAVSWLATVWIAMTILALYLGHSAPLAGVGLAWAVGLIVVGTAGVFGLEALRNAYARWPERRIGTVLVATSFAALMVLFLADRPEMWGLRMRVTETGAVLLALALTFWVAGPAVTLALRALSALPAPAPRALGGGGHSLASDLGIGLLVGAVLGVLAVPFGGLSPAATAGAAGAVVTSISQAVVDEILLRLVILTSAAWALLRWQRISREEAAVLAVIITAVIQVTLYAPGVMALGFPSTVAAAGFVLVTVLVPALAFGALYWTRGLGSALVADATAVTALALMVM